MYIAGFFDGEGSLHFDREKSTVQIRMDNAYEESLVEIRKSIGCGTITNRGRNRPHHKDRHRLSVSNHVEVALLLRITMPFLTVKKRDATAMIAYIDGRHWRAISKNR